MQSLKGYAGGQLDAVSAVWDCDYECTGLCCHNISHAGSVLQVLDALVRLGLRTETSPETLLEAAQSLHSAAEPTQEQMTRAGALLHRLNTLAQEGVVPNQGSSSGVHIP